MPRSRLARRASRRASQAAEKEEAAAPLLLPQRGKWRPPSPPPPPALPLRPPLSRPMLSQQGERSRAKLNSFLIRSYDTAQATTAVVSNNSAVPPSTTQYVHPTDLELAVAAREDALLLAKELPLP